MPHIHTNPGDHDHTASAFIVRIDGETPRTLLHLHKKLGVWLQPGGHIEVHENPWQAVCHEITEETGYEKEQLRILQPRLRLTTLPNAIIHPQAVVHNTHRFSLDGSHRHTDLTYAFTTTEPPKHDPANGESRELRWVTADELIAPETVQTFESIRIIGAYILTHIIREWESVDLAGFDVTLEP